MLVTAEYGNRATFRSSIANFMRNWNHHYKPADKADMGWWDAFRWLSVALYTWALQMYQTLLNFTGHRAIICYSFLCLADKVGQFMWSGQSDHTPTSQVMCCKCKWQSQLCNSLKAMTRATMETSHYLPCVFNTVQHQQQVKGWVLHHSLKSKCCNKECSEIIRALQGYAHSQNTMHGYPSPISLDKLHSLVLPPELYDLLYQPRPMAPPSANNPCREQLLDDNDDDTMPAAAPGCSTMALHMRKFATTSIEQENEID